MFDVAKRESRPIRELMPGDCFFYMTPAERERREGEILSLVAAMSEVGERELTAAERLDLYRAAAAGYIVQAIVKDTGERCSLSIANQAYHVWYDGDELVQWTPDRREFDRMLDAQRRARKEMADAQQRVQKSRSKKKNKDHEVLQSV